jgi:hypothetical protein
MAMHITLDPGKFCDQKLVLQSIGEDDHRVVIANHTAGRIFRTARGSVTHIWFWTITGPYCGEVGISTSGDCATLGEARLAFRAAFDSWHAWAIRQNSEVSWHE